MSNLCARFVCRILVVCLIGLPFQTQAGLIGSDQVVAAAQLQGARDTVSRFVNRADVASQFESLGLSAQAARERVGALTDSEVAGLAGQIDSLPAGANGSGVGMILVIVLVIWYLYKK